MSIAHSEETPPLRTPPVRRGRISLSMKLQPTPPRTASPHLDVSITNDDDAEKRNRIKNKLQDRDEDRKDDRFASFPKEKLQKLTDEYRKITDNNKLNQANAFDYPVIDCMAEYIRRAPEDNNIFSSAALMVDSCMRVYSYRVDAVHEDFNNLASGMSKQQRQRDANEDDSDDEGTQKKKKRRPVRKGTSIENPKTLNCKLELKPEVDCYFQKSRATMENVYNGGLFLMALDVDGNGRLLMDGEAKAFPPKSELYDNEDFIDASILEDTIHTIEHDDVEICPSFQFEWEDDWRPKDNTTMDEDMPDNGFDYDADAALDTGAECDDVVADIGMDDSGSTDNTAVTLGTVGQDAEGAASVSRELMLSRLAPSQLMQHVSLAQQDFGFLNPNVITDWPLDMNKTLKLQLRDRRIADPNAPKKPKKPKMSPNFDVDTNMALELIKKVRSLTAKKRTEWVKQRSLKVADFPKIAVEDLVKLFLKHDFVFNPNKRGNDEVDDQIDEEIQLKLGNTSNFFDVEDDDDYDDAPAGDHVSHVAEEGAQEGASQSVSSETGEQLLEPPKKIAFVRLDVPKQNKKMDMAKLKETLWNILSKGRHEEKMEDSMKFSELCKVLPTHFRKISQQMTENLSIPLVMAALLHLANEKGLLLSNVDEPLSEVRIEQGATEDLSEEDSSEDEAPTREMPGRNKKAQNLNYVEDD